MRYLFIPLSLMLFCMGCNQTSDTSKEETKNIIRVTTIQSEKKKYKPVRTYSGTAYAFKEANLGTTLPGKVEKVHYQEGERVSEGNLLVELSAELYAQALAKRNSLEKDFQRVSRLREKGSVTEQKYDHVKAKFEAAKAEARMMKENCEIRAPFSGVVVDYLVKEGENFMFSPSLKPGYSHTSGIVQLMQLNRLKVKIDVNEKELPDIRVGQSAEVKFDALPDTSFNGRVSHIDPILSTATHTAKVEVTVSNGKRKLKPGMYATVRIQMPDKKNVFVPLNAIFRQSGTGNDYVFVVTNDNRAIRKPVTRISTRGKEVAISGIEEGREVVVHGKNKLKSGDWVKVDNQ